MPRFVLLLLPPSESKHAPEAGAPVDLAALAHADALTKPRERLLGALERLARGSRKRGLEALGLSEGQAHELERDGALRTAPAAPAAEVYTGVLFARLGLATLSPEARARADAAVLIASALWGVVRPTDRIPAYKLSMGAALPRTTGLAALWRAPLAKALGTADDRLVVDCRSGAYAAAWHPRGGEVVAVAARTPDGRPISHMAKAARGDVSRMLLESSPALGSARDALDVVTAAGERAVLLEPPRAGAPWTLELTRPAAGG